jgi:hypothetical protein
VQETPIPVAARVQLQEEMLEEEEEEEEEERGLCASARESGLQEQVEELQAACRALTPKPKPKPLT